MTCLPGSGAFDTAFARHMASGSAKGEQMNTIGAGDDEAARTAGGLALT